MSDMIKHILSEDFVAASSIFEDRLNDILEQKLLEMKKMLQTEVTGGLTKADIEKRIKAGYVRASEVLPDPRDIEIKSFDYNPSPGKKITAKRKKKISEALSDTDIERIGRERQAAQNADLQNTFGHAPADQKLKRLLPTSTTPIAKKTSGGDYVAGSDYERQARELKAKGSRGAAKWLKKTKTARNVLGFVKTMGHVAAGIGKGLADNSPI